MKRTCASRSLACPAAPPLGHHGRSLERVLWSAQASGAAPAAGGDEALMDAQLEDDLAAMGIASPVTKATAGALYHQELSRQARPRGQSLEGPRAHSQTGVFALIPEGQCALCGLRTLLPACMCLMLWCCVFDPGQQQSDWCTDRAPAQGTDVSAARLTCGRAVRWAAAAGLCRRVGVAKADEGGAARRSSRTSWRRAWSARAAW